MIKTFAEARTLIRDLQICTIFASEKSGLPSLWEHIDIPEKHGCSKSQFDTALKNLQISLNVVRANDPTIERDTWLPFQELYPGIWDLHVTEE